MKDKLKKPLSCRNCPAIQILKKSIRCPVNKIFEEVNTKKDEQILWETCPLDWAKGNNNGNRTK